MSYFLGLIAGLQLMITRCQILFNLSKKILTRKTKTDFFPNYSLLNVKIDNSYFPILIPYQSLHGDYECYVYFESESENKYGAIPVKIIKEGTISKFYGIPTSPSSLGVEKIKVTLKSQLLETEITEMYMENQEIKLKTLSSKLRY